MITTNDSLLISIDMQEKLVPIMHNKDKLIQKTEMLLEGANLLGFRILCTEQYPKGLGNTLERLKKGTILEKTTFSIFKDSNIKDFITKSGARDLIICGIESHICVLQSVLDAIKLGFKVWLINDAISARESEYHKIACNLMQQEGAKILCVESLLFALLKDSKHPHFKEISRHIKEAI